MSVSNFFHPSIICDLLAFFTFFDKHYEKVTTSNRDWQIPSIIIIENVLEKQTHQGPQSYEQYSKQLYRKHIDYDLLKRHAIILSKVKNLHFFARLIKNLLTQLTRFPKIVANNLSFRQIFMRKCQMHFQRMTFQELVHVHQFFIEFMWSKQTKPILNSFYIDHKMEQIKFIFEFYSISVRPNGLKQIIKKIRQAEPKSRKIDFLEGLHKIAVEKNSKGLDSIYRFFDLEYQHLMPKPQIGRQNSCINHALLTVAHAHLKLGHIDEAVRGINESLTFSRKNSDHECINYCIVYMYQIAGLLGNIDDQFRLTEHAISHSLSINNGSLIIHSCLNRSKLEKNYDLSNQQNSILKNKKIEWTKALHDGRQKVMQNYQNSKCETYHFEKNLIVPLILYKAAVVHHIPQLKSLLYQGVFNTPEIKALDYYKQLVEPSAICTKIQNARVCYNRQQLYTYNLIIVSIQSMVSQSSLKDYIEYKNFRNEVLIQKKLMIEAMKSVSQVINICRKKSFKKHHYVVALVQLAKIYGSSDKFYLALNTLQEAKQHSLMSWKEDVLLVNIETIDLLLQNDYITRALEILKETEEALISRDNPAILSSFYLLKAEAFYKIVECVEKESDVKSLRQQADQFQVMGIMECLNEYNLMKLEKVLFKRLRRHPEKKYSEAFEFIKKAILQFKKLRVNYRMEENSPIEIAKGIAQKVKNMLLE